MLCSRRKILLNMVVLRQAKYSPRSKIIFGRINGEHGKNITRTKQSINKILIPKRLVLRIAQPSFQTTHNPLKLSKSRRNSSRSKRTTRTSLKWVRAKRPNLNDAAVHEIVQYILWVTILLSPYMGDGATRFARIVEAAPLYPSSSRLSLRTRGKAGTPCSSKSAIMLSVLRRSPPSRGRRFEFSRMAECGDWVF
jgi:hypothetical protein